MATNTNPFYTYSATAGSSKTLQKPQDGGDNNQWGNYINTDLDEIVAAVNALSDKIADANEKTLVDFTATGSAVNHIGITNAATGNPPQISSAGSDTNVDLTLTAKGTGDINLTPGTNGDVNIPASKGITFGDDGEKIEGDGTDLTIASSNDLNLTATTDINVPADVGLTFGDDGEKIEGDGTDLTIASSATLNVNTGSSSGNDLKVNASQLVVEGDTGNVAIGTATPETRFGFTPKLQVEGTGTDAGIAVARYSNDNSGPVSIFSKSRGTSVGSDTIVANNDILGAIYFAGADGTDQSSTGASIVTKVDGTPGGNDMPGRLVFATTADGASSPTERIRIDSSGDVTVSTGNLIIGTAGQGITFGGDPDGRESSATAGDRTLYDYEEGSFSFAIRGNSGTGYYTKIGRLVHIQMYYNGYAGTTANNNISLPFTNDGPTIRVGSLDSPKVDFTEAYLQVTSGNSYGVLNDPTVSNGDSIYFALSFSYYTT